MKKQTFSYFCDICKKQVEESELLTVKYPVVFVTEQNEGHIVEPYISQEEIDMCPDCTYSVLKLGATGCMGFNKYYIKEDDREQSDIYKLFKKQKR